MRFVILEGHSGERTEYIKPRGRKTRERDVELIQMDNYSDQDILYTDPVGNGEKINRQIQDIFWKLN